MERSPSRVLSPQEFYSSINKFLTNITKNKYTHISDLQAFAIAILLDSCFRQSISQVDTKFRFFFKNRDPISKDGYWIKALFPGAKGASWKPLAQKIQETANLNFTEMLSLFKETEEEKEIFKISEDDNTDEQVSARIDLRDIDDETKDIS